MAFAHDAVGCHFHLLHWSVSSPGAMHRPPGSNHYKPHTLHTGFGNRKRTRDGFWFEFNLGLSVVTTRFLPL